ncbi:MAG: CvpA family protein [Planctomycetes bacterium]|nr:CvpA family protein [Planctomycetota bacterium]
MSDIATADQTLGNAAERSSASSAELSPPLRASAQFFVFSLILLGIVLSAAVDVLIGIVVLSAGVWARRGFKAGLIKSGLIIISLLAVCAWAVPLGKALTPYLRAWCDWPFVPARHLSILVVALGILAAGYLLGVLLSAGYLRRYGRLGRKARLLGMGAGIVEGVLLSTTAFIALLAVETPARMGLSMIMDDNAAARGVYDQLVFLRGIADSTAVGKKLAEFSKGQREVLEMGGSLAIISRYDGTIDNLKNHPFIVQVLAENTAISRITREIRNDRALKLAVKSGDLRAMLNSSTVTRLMDDVKLAREVERYRDELFGAVMVSVPFEYREEANAELAKLHGMPVKEFLVYASKRVAALEDELRARARQ